MFPSFLGKAILPALVLRLLGQAAFSASADAPENLLKNGTFERGAESWEVHGWGENPKVTKDIGQLRAGHPSIRIEMEKAGDMSLDQAVTVKPNTRYRLSGWIKTENVVKPEGEKQRSGEAGANLSISGTYDHSSFVSGTADWTPVSVDFSSGSKTSIRVGPRMGHFGKWITGTAWFAEGALTELGADASAVAGAKSPTPGPAERPAEPQPNRVQDPQTKALAEAIAGTKWLWYNRADRVLEFRKDGKVNLDDWTRTGLVTGWEATGPNEVTLTILQGRTKDTTSTLTFNKERTSFTGVDFHGQKKIGESPRFQGSDHRSAAAIAVGRTDLLSPLFAGQWQNATGDWKMENGVLTGSGNSTTSCYITLAPPFTLEYEFKVLKGMRPRVRFGRFSCGNEGYKTTIGLYPPGKDGGLFPYELNRAYRVTLVVTKDKVQLEVDGQLVSTGPGLDKPIDKLDFSGGDNWSKGTTEFRDVVIIKD